MVNVDKPETPNPSVHAPQVLEPLSLEVDPVDAQTELLANPDLAHPVSDDTVFPFRSDPNHSLIAQTGSGLSPSPLRRLLQRAGIDRAIAFTVLARGWSSIAGLVTVALIARTLSPAEQGYYYTFGSMVAMQLVFELGFSVVILQLASHETAHLTMHEDGRIEGEEQHHARLASVLRKSLHWYTIAAGLMGVMLILGGELFFSRHVDPHHVVAWRGPWIAVVLASCLTFQVDPIFSFLEGCGFVARVARTRLAQALLGSALAWGALLLHHGLFAPAMMVSGQAIAALFWLYRRKALLVGLYRFGQSEFRIDWWTEVWPFQWRIAVSYACGFFIFQLFNPVLFAYWGPAEAGRMGMSLNISNAIAAVAIAWINTKAAPFGQMIARRDFAMLDRVFFRAAAQSLALSLSTSGAVFAVLLFMRAHHIGFARRIISPLPLALLFLSMNINQVVSSMALYLRAHKQEKFLLNSIFGAIAVAIATFILGKLYGVMGITAGQIVISVLLGLGYGTYTFMKWRRIWHAV